MAAPSAAKSAAFPWHTATTSCSCPYPSAAATAERKHAQSAKRRTYVPPMEALRAWMLLFVDYIATKQIIAPALNALVGGPSKVIEASYAPIHKAARALVKRAIKSGDIR
jgi:hypothetical protein